MTFIKGNKEAKKKKGTQYNTGVQDYLAYLASGAARHYYTKLEEQFQGKELSEPEREAMTRFEKNTEFIAPKLARIEKTSDNKHEITFKPLLGGLSSDELATEITLSQEED